MQPWLSSLNELGAAAVLTAVEVIGDVAAKRGDNDALLYGAYNVNAYVLKNVLAHNGIARTNAYWNAMTNVTHVLIGSIAFGEELTTTDYAGIALITAGILLLGT